MASRLRECSERTKILSENQYGFRPRISTGDAAQILIRMNEELQGNLEQPKAKLLDIKKAYLRVNKDMLKRYGMKQETLRILRGLRENTQYEVEVKTAQVRSGLR